MTPFERNHTAKAIRNVRKILQKGRSEELIDNSPTGSDKLFSASLVGLCLVVAAIILLIGCLEGKAHADEQYSNLDYVRAIYLAEGGTRAQYAYGIRSVHYKTTAQARQICLNTVKNNRKRFELYGYKHYSRFIDFLQSRYCPTASRGLTQSEKRLNGFWAKNVSFFLGRA